MKNLIKGGPWKNSEDEVLKASVMKYGLNQWSRISSLIVRKSAKQCKARWYEWLDPQIKKTEWTTEEEAKLLHMAKLFPSQWRTIAPSVGRTPAQCLEHYEHLIHQACGTEMGPNDPRALQPGEIEPLPETKPPKPDPVDMDEDEKEMIQEARARLANTRGKKANRKIREKQLEEGRRLATLQKKRELKAAGIEIELRKRVKPKMREMDYNVEIPLFHYVPQPVYQTQSEAHQQFSHSQQMIAAQQLEGQRRDEMEARFREQDKRRMEALRTHNLPEALRRIERANAIPLPVVRARLDLPPPQVTEEDLVQFGKLGDLSELGNQVTGDLVGEAKEVDLFEEQSEQVQSLEEVYGLTEHRLTAQQLQRAQEREDRAQLLEALRNIPPPQNDYVLSSI